MIKEEKIPLYMYEKHADVLERDLFEQGASQGWLKINRSYNNVFNSVQRLSTMLKVLRVEIAYGYMEIQPNLYLRHCFLVQDDKVIDTNIHFYSEQPPSKYYVFWKADVPDYVQTILHGKDEHDLFMEKTLEKYEKEWLNYTKRNHIKSIY